MTSDYIDEEEIKNYINDQYKLDLTKEALTKPTKKVVIDLVTRFLDDLNRKWRNQDQEEVIICHTFMFLKGMIKDLDNINIILDDLINPTRERTTILFNYLILKRAYLFEIVRPGYEKYWGQCPTQRIDDVRNEVERVKSNNEELQHKLSQKSLSDLKNAKKKANLEERKKEAEKRALEVEPIKQRCREKEKQIEERRKKLADLERKQSIDEHCTKLAELSKSSDIKAILEELSKLKSYSKNTNINTTYDKPAIDAEQQKLEIIRPFVEVQVRRVEREKREDLLQNKIRTENEKHSFLVKNNADEKQKKLKLEIENSKRMAELQQELDKIEQIGLERVTKKEDLKKKLKQQIADIEKTLEEEIQFKTKKRREKREAKQQKWERLKAENKKSHETLLANIVGYEKVSFHYDNKMSVLLGK